MTTQAQSMNGTGISDPIAVQLNLLTTMASLLASIDYKLRRLLAATAQVGNTLFIAVGIAMAMYVKLGRR